MSKWPTMNTEWNLYPKLWTFSQADKATSMVSQNKLFSCEGTLSGQEWNNILKLKWVFVNHKWNSFIYTFLSPITNNVKFWILSDTLFYTGLKLQQWNFWTAFLYCSAKYIYWSTIKDLSSLKISLVSVSSKNYLWHRKQ